jgi:drug/metabolite transporter (DMT)-like permease
MAVLNLQHRLPVYLKDVPDRKDQATQTEESASLSGTMWIKACVLAALLFHNVCSTAITRYSRSQPSESQYNTRCAVIATELLKGVICTSVLLSTKGSVRSVAREHWKSAFPAVLFFIQNNLLYLGLGNLEASTFQILMQFRLVTTAAASVILLRRKLSSMQWCSLFILGCGVATVQLSTDKQPAKNPQLQLKTTSQGCWLYLAFAVHPLLDRYTSKSF